jgi:two-component system NtrC family sensor kinase
LTVNASWSRFAQENNGILDKLSVGVNYLALCDTAAGTDAEEAQEAACGIREVLQGVRHEFVLEYPCHSPEQKRWFLCWVSRFNSHDRNWLVIAHENITSRKEKEIALLELHAQLLQQEKLASIGQLAAGVAHEINNPMGFIASNLGTLQKYLDRLVSYCGVMTETVEQCTTPEQRITLEENRKKLKIDHILADAQHLVAESLEGADRVKYIVNDLKSFARSDQNLVQPLQLNQCVATALNLVKNEYKYCADLQLHLQDNLPELNGNSQQLVQVICNLVVNAAHALGEIRGEITVATEQNGDWVLVKVSDTGCGIPEELQRRIFEPFFTTKEVGKGTGLGLSISHEIIKKHGGELTMESVVGQGTTFTVRLPLIPRIEQTTVRTDG